MNHTLYFIGLGLFDELDMSIKAQKTLTNCDQIFVECYTSKMMGTDLSLIEKTIGKHISILSREETEEGAKLFSALKKSNVAFLTGGDPMTATTHVDLRIQSIKKGYNTQIIHGTSILTAVPGLLGLQHYKFGRTTTLVKPEKNYFPTSPYDVIQMNKKNGLHTLILLDIQQENQYYMSATEGIHLLCKMEKKRKEHVISDKDIIAVVAQAGSAKPLIKADTISIMKTNDFGPPLHTIVYPGELHFMEKEAFRILTQ